MPQSQPSWKEYKIIINSSFIGLSFWDGLINQHNIRVRDFEFEPLVFTLFVRFNTLLTY